MRTGLTGFPEGGTVPTGAQGKRKTPARGKTGQRARDCFLNLPNGQRATLQPGAEGKKKDSLIGISGGVKMMQEKKLDELVNICGKTYRILRLLGHGKGGYAYLADCSGRQAVVKQIHHEPCDYYTFGNKIEAEKRDYECLKALGIRMPQMLAIDPEAERIVKEYIEGPTVFDLVRDGVPAEPFLPQVREMAQAAKKAGLNIDYFPTNFVVRDGLLWYVDYECNAYMDEWSFENWGIRYWSRTPEFEAHLRERMS